MATAPATKTPRKRRKNAANPQSLRLTRDERRELDRARGDWEADGLDWAYWVRDASDRRAVLAGCRPDPAKADLTVRFFEEALVLSKGESVRPFVLADFQKHGIIRPLFGWQRPDPSERSGWRRRFSSASIWLSQGSGKTTIAAGIVAKLLCADGEHRALVYSAANDREQASYIFDEIATMQRLSPELKGELSAWKSTKTIVYERMMSTYKALSADASSAEGKDSHGVVIDEIHAFGEAGRRLFGALKYTLRKRPRSLLIIISTAGRDQSGIGWQEYLKAKAIADGVNDEEWWKFVYIAAAPSDADWTDEEVWKAANPALGTTLKLEDLRQDFIEARKSPHDELLFRQRRLNQWIARSEEFVPTGAWNKCGRELADEALKGKRCWGGLDLSSRLDTTAFVLCFEIEPDLPALIPYFWIPRYDKNGRPRTDIDDYIAWGRRGLVTVVESNTIDFAMVRDRVNWARTEFGLEGVAADPMFAAQLLQQLGEDDRIPAHEHKQNYTQFTEPTLEFQRRAVSQRIVHGKHPILDLQLQATGLKVGTGDLVMPARPKGSRWRIDGVVASIMALNMFLKFKGTPRPGYGVARDIVWV
ncbi:MAG: terminase TerL endonuclease subunit [Candidatus Nanopelagicales bacterium]|nr:terminase TerL endonuclease subunit [Candidatus Nanopelagicales bacterium]